MSGPVSLYRIARHLHRLRVPLLPRIISRLSQLVYHCYLPESADIGDGFEVGYHGIGVIVHARAKIGRNVFIGPGAVIGGRSQEIGVPVVEDDVYIAAGAKVLGNIRIGSGSVVGANAVVIKSVPARSAVAGVPSRIIKSEIDVRALTGWPNDQ